MALQDLLTEALSRGEKIKDQMIKQILHSEILDKLLGNEKVLNSLLSVLNSRSKLEKFFEQQLNVLCKLFEVPSREELKGMEKQLHRLENEIEHIHRRILTHRLKNSTRAASARKTTTRKSSTHRKKK